MTKAELEAEILRDVAPLFVGSENDELSWEHFGDLADLRVRAAIVEGRYAGPALRTVVRGDVEEDRVVFWLEEV